MILQRAARKYLRTGAPWMLERYASTFFESLGAVLDCEAQRVMDGRLAAIPYAGSGAGAAYLASGQRIECRPDALPWHANDRAIPIYATEPEASQRYRLSRWHQLHARRGTPRGIMEHVQPYFLGANGLGPLPVIRIVHQAGDGSCATWHKLDAATAYTKSRATPSNFDYDGQTSKWSRWGAFIEMLGTAYSEPFTYDDGSHIYDGGGIYDQGGAQPFTSAMAADVVSMFVDWKAAHSWCMFVVASWRAVDPTGTPTQDATGWWSLPNGKWGTAYDPVTHLQTRPPSMLWLRDTPG